jgi:hypothetical protein
MKNQKLAIKKRTITLFGSKNESSKQQKPISTWVTDIFR